MESGQYEEEEEEEDDDDDDEEEETKVPHCWSHSQMRYLRIPQTCILTLKSSGMLHYILARKRSGDYGNRTDNFWF